MPAPAEQEARRFQLVNAAGANAEKRLRALLAACPEWSDRAARLRLAALVQAEDERSGGAASGLPELLRSHDSAKMRKLHMLRLAHAWCAAQPCGTANTHGRYLVCALRCTRR
jgi:hypothetical protein